MATLQYKTRGMSNPKGKPRVYFCCHPEDFSAYFEEMATEILSIHDCAIWYADKKTPRDAAFLTDLGEMLLFVMPVTEKLLTTDNYALDREFAYAKQRHIPVLPLMQEPGLDSLFNEKCGNLQYLDKNVRDLTAISYPEKLKNFLDATILDEETIKKVQAAFDAYIFLSYRKKDRKHAQELMRLIHKNAFCRDVAIWYDEFLTPGENFNDAIRDAFEKSELFVMAVTPSMLEKSVDKNGKQQENYIVQIEYPMAKKSGKPILPVEMETTDRNSLARKYANIPACTDPRNADALAKALQAALRNVALRRGGGSPEHDFFIGLAYLKGIDVEVDYGKAVPLIESAAEKGVVEAAEMLVRMHGEGMGVPRSLERMEYWQNKLIMLRQNRFDRNPTQENGLNLLMDIQAQMDLHESTGNWSQRMTMIKLLLTATEQVIDKTPCAEALRYMSVGFHAAADMQERGERYAAAVEYYRQSEDVLRHCLQSKGVELRSDGIKLTRPMDQTTMILLQDYCTSLCSIADCLVNLEQPREAERLIRQCYQYLISPVMENNYPAYQEQLSTIYSRMGNIEASYSRFDRAREWYEKALQVDIQRVIEVKQNHDFDAYDACARGLYAYGTANPQDPNANYLYSALDIWKLLAELVPQFPEYRERAEELEPYVDEVARIIIRRNNYHPQHYKYRRRFTSSRPAGMVIEQLQQLRGKIQEKQQKAEALLQAQKDHQNNLAAAAKGDGEAMLKVAEAFRSGKGTDINLENAGKYGEMAAEKGVLAAFDWLADFYRESNPQKAKRYQQESDRLKEKKRQQEEAERKKREEQEAKKQAFEADLRAAKSGDAAACLALADRYTSGNGTYYSDSEAVKWAEKALSMKHWPAAAWLAKYYVNWTIDRRADYAKARKYAKLAAKHGQSRGSGVMRTIYKQGLGCKKNKLLAWYWDVRCKLQRKSERRRRDREWKKRWRAADKAAKKKK